jgi:glycosyl transferase family 25
MKTISDIKHAFYINLETRPDRKEHVEKQMELIGIKATRFNAIRLKNGALGCSMSHLKILENAKKNNLDHVLIVEDDILFTKPDIFVIQVNKFLSNHSDFDVVLVAGNNMPPYTEIDDVCIQVIQCQTTTGYLVQKHYFDTLIANFREGIQKLMIEPYRHTLYAIDKYWFSLQKKDKWYLITPLTVTQREDYSDIEQRTTNYSRAMLDIDKEAFFKWQMEQQMEQQIKYQIK